MSLADLLPDFQCQPPTCPASVPLTFASDVQTLSEGPPNASLHSLDKTVSIGCHTTEQARVVACCVKPLAEKVEVPVEARTHHCTLGHCLVVTVGGSIVPKPSLLEFIRQHSGSAKYDYVATLSNDRAAHLAFVEVSGRAFVENELRLHDFIFQFDFRYPDGANQQAHAKDDVTLPTPIVSANRDARRGHFKGNGRTSITPVAGDSVPGTGPCSGNEGTNDDFDTESRGARAINKHLKAPLFFLQPPPSP